MDDSAEVVLADVIYPESDGQPMADNTLQWDWMVKIVGELRELFAGQNVFVAGNLFWYPVQFQPNTVAAPDAMVVFGRPPGYRGSYKQWEEEGIGPQVVFEILSPKNTRDEMDEKLLWYERYGVEEYYFIDPYKNQLLGWLRDKNSGKLHSVYPMAGYVSPRLGVRFDVNGEVQIFRPDGRVFQTREVRVDELKKQLAEIEARAAEAEARARAAEIKARAAEIEARERKERARAEHYAAKLRELGISPEDLNTP